ncbi:hypothetical protein RHMOL_Rhmol13G0301500 [Rhododendron molle]|uniref:Uncharacterized protein n=1 Tax=Rhododendron molle TaxID=49168 RepID=A0ACC0LCB5_RHOML|nr:hypothetical protein RHMOL_Rhmol13G0301500 [Rhododendron molle]
MIGVLPEEQFVSEPRRSSDSLSLAIQTAAAALGLRDFRLVQRIGSGDIRRVYLCRLRNVEKEEKMDQVKEAMENGAVVATRQRHFRSRRCSIGGERERRVSEIVEKQRGGGSVFVFNVEWVVVGKNVHHPTYPNHPASRNYFRVGIIPRLKRRTGL